MILERWQAVRPGHDTKKVAIGGFTRIRRKAYIDLIEKV